MTSSDTWSLVALVQVSRFLGGRGNAEDVIPQPAVWKNGDCTHSHVHMADCTGRNTKSTSLTLLPSLADQDEGPLVGNR